MTCEYERQYKKAQLTLRQARDSRACMTALAKKSMANQRKERNVEKYIECVTTLSLTNDNTGLHVSSFVQQELPPNFAKSREIIRKFELIAVQGHPKSSTQVPIESTCNFLLAQSLIVTLDVFPTVLRYRRILLGNSSFSLPHPCLKSPNGGTPSDINIYTADIPFGLPSQILNMY